MLAVAIGLLAGFALWRLEKRKRRPAPLPNEWSLTARPVFSADERTVYRQLREALPNHIVLAKLPLVRFCQPQNTQQVRYWYDLLGSINVSFVVCSGNGRVLVAVDIETDKPGSRRVAQIKQAVLNACRIRHLKCRADQLPSVAELQLLVPHQGAAARVVPPGMHGLSEASSTLAHTVRTRRAERSALWQDSSFGHDSFFLPDSRVDTAFGHSEFAMSTGPHTLPPAYVARTRAHAPAPRTGNETGGSAETLQIGGVVIDTAHSSAR